MILGIKVYLAAAGALLVSVGGGYLISKTPVSSEVFPGGSFNLAAQVAAVASPEADAGKSILNSVPLKTSKGSPQGGNKVLSSAPVISKTCAWVSGDPHAEAIVLNELAWMGSPGEGGADREWIELANRSAERVSLKGWELIDKADQIHIVFGADDAIGGGGFYLLERSSDVAVPGIQASKVYEGTLGNTNEGLELFDRSCTLRDAAHANPNWSAGVNEARRTMERNREGFGWHTSLAAGGTPKAENSLPPPPPPPPQGVIEIIANDPSASEVPGDTGSFRIIRTGSVNVPLTVYFVIEGTAVNGTDYAGTNGNPINLSRVMQAGATTTYITVWAKDDALVEPTETVLVKLKSTSIASFSIGTSREATVNIIDNDINTPPPPPPLENTSALCADGIDNDGDGLVDLNDPDCAPFIPPPPQLENTSVLCADGIDNDGDGLIDLDDPDCAPFIPPPPPSREDTLVLCTDGVDNDADSLIDFADPDCAPFVPPPPSEDTSALCADGIDNDGDGLVDLNDPDCAPFIPPPPASNVDHILISEIQTSGGPGATTNDFIEIYNPTGAPFNLNGHRLVKRTANGTSDALIKSWTSDAFIPAHGFYLWASSGYASIPVVPDAATSGSIADNNGIAIRFGANDTGTIIDSVAWGTAANGFGEGTLLVNFEDNQSFERKAWTGSCTSAQGTGEALGNGCDIGDNAIDFEVRTAPLPQNSANTPEP